MRAPSRLGQVMFVAGLIVTATGVFGETVWDLPGDGLWHDPLNWTLGVPDGEGAVAVFRNESAQDMEITLDAPATVGVVVFENRSDAFVIGSETLTFSNNGQPGEIQVRIRDSGAIRTPVAFEDGLHFLGRAFSSRRYWMNGVISGTGDVVFGGPNVRLGNANTYSGTTYVNRGVVSAGVSTAFGDTIGATVVGSRDTYVEVWGDLVEDFFLDNARGIGGNGALSTGGTQAVTLSGRIDLGDVGSYLGSRLSRMVLTGRVTGGGLTKIGSNALWLDTPDVEYTGPTVIGEWGVGGIIELLGEARLATTSEVILNRGGELGIRRNLTAPDADLIADSIPITLRGGALIYGGAAAGTTRERLGTVTLPWGYSTIDVGGGVENDSRILELASLNRQPGGTVRFIENSGNPLGGEGPDDPRVVVSQAPVLTDGLLGGWAIVMDRNHNILDFAAYDVDTGRGVHRLAESGRPSELEGSSATDHVRVTATAAPLTGDTTIGSLFIAHDGPGGLTNVDLGGHELNVVSGGIVRESNSTEIHNGSLTAGGDAEEGELVFSTVNADVTISADITDNGDAPVGLTFSGVGELKLSGENSFTGPIAVNGVRGLSHLNNARLSFMSAESIPPDADVTINGARMHINFDTETPARFSRLTLRDTSIITSQFGSGTEFPDPIIDADEYHLDGGGLGLSIAGSGTVYVHGGGGSVSRASPDFSGQVFVMEGEFGVGDPEGLGNGTAIVTGGTLRAGGTHFTTEGVQGSVVLAGGELTGILLDGPLTVTEDSSIRTTDGEGKNDYALELGIRGPVLIEASRTLSVNGPRTVRISGDVHLDTAAALMDLEGNTLIVPGEGKAIGGDGLIAAQVTVSDGGAVGPGQSDGLLEISDLTFGPGGRYEWELRDTRGQPGAGWDQLVVSSSLSISATPESPFVIALSSLDDQAAAGPAERFFAGIDWSWQVLAHDGLEDADLARFTIDAVVFLSQNTVPEDAAFALRVDEDGLYVDYHVPLLPGDMDGNGVLDAFDVSGFELALNDPQAYVLANPGFDRDQLGDVNGDAEFDSFDVAAFEAALSGLGAVVPEPSVLTLLILGGWGLAACRIR